MDPTASLAIAAPTEAPALPVLQPLPLRELLPWLVFGGILMLMLVYFVGVEQGAAALFSNHYVHEVVHDGRHVLGFPCH
jgi:hypothetical protein